MPKEISEMLSAGMGELDEPQTIAESNAEWVAWGSPKTTADLLKMLAESA